jgi:hypothetical protein
MCKPVSRIFSELSPIVHRRAVGTQCIRVSALFISGAAARRAAMTTPSIRPHRGSGDRAKGIKIGIPGKFSQKNNGASLPENGRK